MRISKRSTLIVCSLVFAALGAQAQTQPQEEMRFLQPTASLSGNTGLWNVLTPTNLSKGQVAVSVWADRINRNPGQLTITTYGFGGSFGLNNWLELGVNFDVNRRILVRRADQLSLGQEQLGLFGSQVPGATPTLGELMPGSTVMPQLRSPATTTGVLTGRAGFYNMFPFANRIEGNGVGTVNVGLKFSILSESKGAPVSLGVRSYVDIPTHRSVQFLLQRPSQTGGWILGSDLLLGKEVGKMADLYFNAGYRAYDSPEDGRAVVLADSVPLGIGLTVPRDTRFQLMSEVTSEILVGDQTPNTVPDAQNVTDFTIGFRGFINRYLNLSAGYRHPLNQSGGDKNGFVVQLGYTYGPPIKVAPPSPPSLSCSADPAQVDVGGMVRLNATGSSSTGAPLTYEWSTNGGTIQGSGQSVQVSTTGLAPGSYVATVRATEKPGLFADCSTHFTVVQPPPPPMPPTASCSADRTRVQVGEVVNLTVRGNSPDGHPLTYQWSANGGNILGTGPAVRLDTTGASPGTITATAKVTDDRNLSASCTSSITVEAPPPPPPPPQAMMLDTCQFRANSARVDNVCKAKLDSVALRLQSESDATLVIVGSAASTERNAQRLSQTRADNVRAYLAKDKGVAEERLTSRTSAPGTGADARKVEMTLVPRGATFTGYNIQLDIERSRSVQAETRPEGFKDAATGAALPVASKPADEPSANAGPEGETGRRVIASLR
jgi:outer membrane protein OmpA-like peptidoglycan-associated protein